MNRTQVNQIFAAIYALFAMALVLGIFMLASEYMNTQWSRDYVLCEKGETHGNPTKRCWLLPVEAETYCVQHARGTNHE